MRRVYGFHSFNGDFLNLLATRENEVPYTCVDNIFKQRLRSREGRAQLNIDTVKCALLSKLRWRELSSNWLWMDRTNHTSQPYPLCVICNVDKK